MVKPFTESKKGGNNGTLWNGAHPEKFFPQMYMEGGKEIWDVRRTPTDSMEIFLITIS